VIISGLRKLLVMIKLVDTYQSSTSSLLGDDGNPFLKRIKLRRYQSNLIVLY